MNGHQAAFGVRSWRPPFSFSPPTGCQVSQRLVEEAQKRERFEELKQQLELDQEVINMINTIEADGSRSLLCGCAFSGVVPRSGRNWKTISATPESSEIENRDCRHSRSSWNVGHGETRGVHTRGPHAVHVNIWDFKSNERKVQNKMNMVLLYL